jgi:membrane protein implicated in regulation of membrane protease activity
MQIHPEVIFWACAALLLIAAETFVPGAFLLWLGLAAAAMLVIVLIVPGIAMLWQVLLFVLLSFVSIGVFVRFFRGKTRSSDQPLLNRKGEQLVGRDFPLYEAIINGRGRIKMGDALWTVEGPDLPVGTQVRVIAVDSMILKVQEA